MLSALLLLHHDEAESHHLLTPQSVARASVKNWVRKEADSSCFSLGDHIGLYDSLKGLTFTGEDFSILGGGITKGRQGLGERVGILTASQGLPKT